MAELMTPEDEAFLEGWLDERNRCADLASILVSHLLLSEHPDAGAWADALNWFRKRIKGGHMAIYAQRDFDEKFGPVEWPAADSPEED